MLPSTPHHQLLLAFSVFSFLCPLSINNSAMREEGRLISVFTSPSAPPNPVSQSHPLLCSKPPATAPFSLCLNLQWITQIFPPNVPSPLLLYPSPQLQQAFPGNLWTTLAREAGSLTADLQWSKSNPPHTSISLSDYLLWPLPLLSAPISSRSSISPPTCLTAKQRGKLQIFTISSLLQIQFPASSPAQQQTTCCVLSSLSAPFPGS